MTDSVCEVARKVRYTPEGAKKVAEKLQGDGLSYVVEACKSCGNSHVVPGKPSKVQVEMSERAFGSKESPHDPRPKVDPKKE